MGWDFSDFLLLLAFDDQEVISGLGMSDDAIYSLGGGR
jgi:hypothetical protein